MALHISCLFILQLFRRVCGVHCRLPSLVRLLLQDQASTHPSDLRLRLLSGVQHLYGYHNNRQWHSSVGLPGLSGHRSFDSALRLGHSRPAERSSRVDVSHQDLGKSVHTLTKLYSATTSGLMVSMRSLGGAIGLAICESEPTPKFRMYH